jgi:hypothetical protein
MVSKMADWQPEEHPYVGFNGDERKLRKTILSDEIVGKGQTHKFVWLLD